MQDVATPEAQSLPKMRLRLLGFSTLDLLAQALRQELKVMAIQAGVAQADYGAVTTELLKASEIGPDGHIIQMDAQGFFTRDWRQPADVANRLLSQKSQEFFAALEGFAASSAAPVFVTTLPNPSTPQVGFLDGHHPDGSVFLVDHVNRGLRDIAARQPRVILVDTDMAMAHIAPAERSDPKLWYYGRFPYAAAANKALAQAVAQAIAAYAGTPLKVLALDLDDTLWRGIYGEQGVAGLECGDDFPGSAFKALQQECLRLKSQGLLLTILSKNDASALRVFDEHPGMVLKRSDFVAHRSNWQPKADNIRALAGELGLGLGSFLFLDDSPHEREAMRRLAPEVRVLDMPADAALRPDLLRSYAPLWPVRLTEEDRKRSDRYATRVQAHASQQLAASLDDYLTGLEQVLTIEPVGPAAVPRIAQMHARTNQFNLTTLRLSEAEIAAMSAAGDSYCVVQGRVADKFGDHGVVICAVASLDGQRADIMSLLMSCRVIGREVELAFFGNVLERLASRGVDEVVLRFIATEKNAPARAFCESTGLEPSSTSADGRREWTWRKNDATVPGSKFVRVIAAPA